MERNIDVHLREHAHRCGRVGYLFIGSVINKLILGPPSQRKFQFRFQSLWQDDCSQQG